MQHIALTAIQMDHGIQCRVGIDMETVGEYVERLNAGDHAPAIDVFGDSGCCWIGDGWHRVMAARQVGATSIDANVHEGGRQDALKHALRANTEHGLRRTNADKRRCVEVAIAEFSTLSSRGIAALCGVSADMVIAARPQVSENDTSKKTGADGKQYPSKRKPKDTVDTEQTLPIKRNTSQAKIAEVIQAMLAAGNNVPQISGLIGRGEETVRGIIRKFKIQQPSRKGEKARHISSVRIIRETVNAAVAMGHGLRLIRVDNLDLPKSEAEGLLTELTEALKALHGLVKLLKEKSK